jgi:hypothetical protein
MSPLYRGGRRQGATRSSNEYGGKVTYFCTGGAGKARAEAEAARTGLTWLPDGGHGPVAPLERVGPASLRCPVCGLTKPVGYKRRRLIAAAGLTEVDISALPF